MTYFISLIQHPEQGLTQSKPLKCVTSMDYRLPSNLAEGDLTPFGQKRI